MPVTGVQLGRLARRHPAAPGERRQAPGRRVAREGDDRVRGAGADVDEAAVGRDGDGVRAGQRRARLAAGVAVAEMQPAMPLSWTSEPFGWRAKLATAPAVAEAT